MRRFRRPPCGRMSRPWRPTSMQSRRTAQAASLTGRPRSADSDELNARVEDPATEQGQACRRPGGDGERTRLARAGRVRSRGVETRSALTPWKPRRNSGRARATTTSLEDARAQLRALKDRAARTTKLGAAVRRGGRQRDAYLEVNAEAGGTESPGTGPRCCCACTTRWAGQHVLQRSTSRKGHRQRDVCAGRQDHATIMVKAPNAFGWLKSESGVHRLVPHFALPNSHARRRHLVRVRRRVADRR